MKSRLLPAALPRRAVRALLLALALAVALIGIPAAGESGVAAAAAPPCQGDPPPPPPPRCGDQPCPSLPNTGGGGGACEDDPADPACQGQTTAPRLPQRNFRYGERPLIQTWDSAINNTGSVVSRSVTFHPCPGDAPPGGTMPEPTPVPLTPVCAACEAPGVAASVQTPEVQVRMNPETGLVNVPSWFWAEGYRGQDLFATQSWSSPYEPTTIEVRYFVKRYVWNFGDGGQFESRSLGRPYPRESDIRNAYRWSSRTEPAGFFHLALTIEWGVEYRVNGGPPQPLPPVQRRYEAIYPVQELQPMITGP